MAASQRASQLESCSLSHPLGAPEVLAIKVTRKEQTSLPAWVFKGKSRNHWELLRIPRILFRILLIPSPPPLSIPRALLTPRLDSVYSSAPSTFSVKLAARLPLRAPSARASLQEPAAARESRRSCSHSDRSHIASCRLGPAPGYPRSVCSLQVIYSVHLLCRPLPRSVRSPQNCLRCARHLPTIRILML